MALNPLRESLERAGLNAFRQPSGFRTETATALERFRALRQELEAAVRRGEMTPKVAREQAAKVAADLAAGLRARGRDYSELPRVFQERLRVEADERARARAVQSLDSLQRETNRLLQQLLVEQQITRRSGEFEARAYVRSSATSQPAPSLSSLLQFHAWAEQCGDEPAREWARRQLEAFRPLVLDPADHRRIDQACDRPDRVNPRLVEVYIESLKGQTATALEQFVAQALAEHDANACVAAFLLAREASEGTTLRWVRQLLDGLGEVPDSALVTLRRLEADAREAERAAALAQAEQAIAQAEADARLKGVDTPSPAEVTRQNQLDAMPLAAPEETIGLVPRRRGMNLEEYAAFVRPPANPEPPVDFVPMDEERRSP